MVEIVITFRIQMELDPSNYSELGPNPSLAEMIKYEKESLGEDALFLIEDQKPESVTITPLKEVPGANSR